MKTTITIKLPKGNFRIAAESVIIWGLALAIHHTPGKPGRWTVSCPRCGMALGHGSTRVQAEGVTEQRIGEAGRDKVEALLAAQPAVVQSEVDWVEPVRVMAPTINVDAIAITIAERVGVAVEPVRAALSGSGKHAGRLLSKCPSEELAAAAWQAIQPNPFKVSIGRLFFLRGEAKVLFDKLSAHDWPDWLDRDKHALVRFGVW